MKLSNNLTIDNVYDSIVSRHPGIWGYDYEQKAFIRRVLEEGLDVSVYAKSAFDLFQMRQIEYGLESGVNVEVYANSKYTSYHMKVIRLYLEQNLDASHLLDENLHYLTVKRLEQQLLSNSVSNNS